MKELWPWITLALLGAYHGLNPGMGWLFAVTLGLQEQSRKAVIRAFAPIALGHAISIAAVVALVAALQHVISPTILKWTGAGALAAFGLYKLIVPMSCPRWVGMRVGFRELTVWSFLMATACGAGLMVVPVILKLPSEQAAAQTSIQSVPAPNALIASKSTPGPAIKSASNPAPQGDSPDCHKQVAQMAKRDGAGPLTALAAVLLHTAALFLVMSAVALLVFEKIGLAILRKAWYNVDLIWAVALIGAGLITLLV